MLSVPILSYSSSENWIRVHKRMENARKELKGRTAGSKGLAFPRGSSHSRKLLFRFEAMLHGPLPIIMAQGSDIQKHYNSNKQIFSKQAYVLATRERPALTDSYLQKKKCSVPVDDILDNV